MKERQVKVGKLVAEGKSKDEIKSAFAESEARLIDAICSDLLDK
jgi:hypothetical protein